LTASGTPLSAGVLPVSIAIDPSGHFAYVANRNSNDVSAYTLDATTGVLTKVTILRFIAGSQPSSIAID
jgi:YVTN family beta-propeller protein